MRPFRRASSARRLLVALAVGALTLGLAPATAQAALLAPVLVLSLAAPAQATASLRPVITEIAPSYGDTAGGSLVTIFGKNLSHVSRVRFGGIGVTTAIRNVSSTEVQVRTPRHPYGSYYVLVRTPHGVSAPSRKFEFYPRAQITSLRYATGPTSGGQTFWIKGKFFKDVTAVWFGGVRAKSFVTVAATTAINVTTPAHRAGLFDVYVVTRMGASTAVPADQYRFVPPDPRKWSPPQTIDPTHDGIEALSCATAQFCAAIDGAGGLATFDGSRWTYEATSLNIQSADQLYCFAAQLCFAWSVLNHADSAIYDGATWREPAQFPVLRDKTITCLSTTWCRAIDTAGSDYIFDGSTWTATGQHVAPSVVALTCDSTTSCMAVDAFGKVYRFANGSWQPPVESLPFEPDSASCTSDGLCLAYAAGPPTAVAVYTHGTWTKLTSPPFTIGYEVDCAGADFCAALDTTGDAWTFDADTNTWAGPEALELDADGGPALIGCSSTHVCVAADWVGFARTFDGTELGDVQAVDHVAGHLTSISCPRVGQCTAIDGYGNTFRQTPDGWGARTPTLPPKWPTPSHDVVSCPTVDFCLAVSSDEAAVFRDGVWGPPKTLPDATVDAVSCASPSFCVAATLDGNALTFNGSTWTATAATKHPMSGVSCIAVGECMVITSSRYAAKLHDGTWSPTAPLTGVGDMLDSIACTSVGRCLLGTEYGYIVHYAGKVAAVDRKVVWNNVSGLACTSTSSCDLVAGGMTAHYNGVYWTSPVLTDFSAIACAGTSTCVATTSSGGVETSSLS